MHNNTDVNIHHPGKLSNHSSKKLSNSPLLLWFNLTRDSGPTDLSRRFEEVFTVNAPQTNDTIKNNDEKPDFMCFEYDYPDCDSLNLLKQTRKLYPSTPTIMFTLQHSEDLAIWALRNRVWDYYYKPISKSCIGELSREIINYHNSLKTGKQSHHLHFINSSYPDEVRIKTVSNNNTMVDLALNYLHMHYNKKVMEKTIADLCHMSRFQFARCFKRAVGTTFQSYLLTYRIDRAKILLQNPGARIHDVAYSVGFTDPAYFTRVFKRIEGTSPSNYRQSRLQ